MTTEILDRIPATAPQVAGANLTVIDNTSGVVSFEYKAPSLMLAEATARLNEAEDMVPCIDSTDMLQEASNLLQVIVGGWKSLDEQRLATTKPLREKTDTINADFKPAIEMGQQAEKVLKAGISSYTTRVEQERKRQEAERQRLAEQERQRAAEEARQAELRAQQEAADQRRKAEEEAQRQREEADRQAAELRAQAAAAGASGDGALAETLNQQAESTEQTAAASVQTTLSLAEEQATAIEQNGQAAAESMRSVADMVIAQPVAMPRARAAGIATSTKFAAQVNDPQAFIKYVLENWSTLNHLVTIETGKLNALAQNQKERFSMPGCELLKSTGVSARRAVR